MIPINPYRKVLYFTFSNFNIIYKLNKSPVTVTGFTLISIITLLQLTIDCLLSVCTRDHFMLNEMHDYYAQIQGQLHLTGFTCCDLVVWTKKDFQIIRIAKDMSWISNIQKLIEFYMCEYLEMIGGN